MMLTTQTISDPTERIDVQKLGEVVEDAILLISAKTGLDEEHVLDILEKVRVPMVGELKNTLEILEARGMIQPLDKDRMCAAIKSAISSIAHATDLSTAEITEVFCKQDGASLEHIIFRLRARSILNRSNHV